MCFVSGHGFSRAWKRLCLSSQTGGGAARTSKLTHYLAVLQLDDDYAQAVYPEIMDYLREARGHDELSDSHTKSH